MTEPDTNTIRWLNLLYGSPSFVIRIDPRSQTPTVVQINVVPNDGTYWIAGTTILPRRPDPLGLQDRHLSGREPRGRVLEDRRDMDAVLREDADSSCAGCRGG